MTFKSSENLNHSTQQHYHHFISIASSSHAYKVHLFKTAKPFSDVISILNVDDLNVQLLYEGWCTKSLKINNIFIHENNKFYTSWNNKQEMVLGKSDVNTDLFDVLVFISNKSKSPIIPSFITHINSDCFNQSKIIDTIIFDEKSELSSFSEYGFVATAQCKLFITAYGSKDYLGIVDPILHV